MHVNKESLQMHFTLLMFFQEFGKIYEVHEGVVKILITQRVKVSNKS